MAGLRAAMVAVLMAIAYVLAGGMFFCAKQTGYVFRKSLYPLVAAIVVALLSCVAITQYGVHSDWVDCQLKCNCDIRSANRNGYRIF